jgi:PhnB protein
MSIVLNPYLNFRDNAREALEFYKSVLGGELALSTFEEFQASEDPDDQKKIMHGQLTTPAGLVLMGADTPKAMEYEPITGSTVSLSGDDEATLTGYWEGLSEGATITQPLVKAQWGDSFGMLTDRFGVPWMFNIGSSPA